MSTITSSNTHPIVIIGAGITGLTAAHRLTQLGHSVRLFESSNHIGGNIRTHRDGPWLHETGPNSLLNKSPVFTNLLRQLHLDIQRLSTNPAAKKRFILRNQTPIPAPSLFSNKLYSPRAKLRILTELFQRPRTRSADISLAQLFSEHFGPELTDYALNPLVSGIYAGNPSKLSAQHAFPILWSAEQSHGSLIRGALSELRQKRQLHPPLPASEKTLRLYSFPRGLIQVPETLAQQLPAGTLTLNTALTQIIPPTNGTSTYQLTLTNGTSTQQITTRALILAIPPHALAQIQIGSSTPLASLAEIENPPVTSLFLGYHKTQIRHHLDGFGLLSPKNENQHYLGILFSSSLFPHRAPENHSAITVLLGGTTNPQITKLPPDEILRLIQPQLTKTLGITCPPTHLHAHTTPRAIPQYNLGHDRHLHLINQLEQQHRHLHLIGNFRNGVSVVSCAENALSTADQLHSQLQQS